MHPVGLRGEVLGVGAQVVDDQRGRDERGEYDEHDGGDDQGYRQPALDGQVEVGGDQHPRTGRPPGERAGVARLAGEGERNGGIGCHRCSRWKLNNILNFNLFNIHVCFDY